jgi:hypothetical protein
MRKYLAGASPILALAFTSLGLGAGLPSTADTGPSATSRVTSTDSGQCSKPEAIDAVKRLGLSDVSATYPVFTVLCGAFTGTGSQDMVVSIAGLENVGMLYWAVFRWSGSNWQLVMKQRHVATLTTAGSDIRETQSIYRDSDPRCCPSGGTKTRVWHWSGSRFLAGAWEQKQTTDAFFSPSRNIFCWMDDDGQKVGVGCQTWNPPQRLVKMGAEGGLKIRSVPASQCGCVPDGPRTLAYGKQVTVGRYRCESQQMGMRCTVIRSGKGFLINRDGVTRVG